MYILRIVVYIIAVIVASICAIGCEDENVNDGQNVIDDSDVLKGVYTSVILGLEQTMTFKNNGIVESEDVLSGKTIYKYTLYPSAIQFKNVATGDTFTWDYQDLREDYDCIVINGISYYKD